MALITRSSTASVDVTTAQFAPQITGLYAGEELDVAAPCYIKTSDGLVYMSNATNTDEAAEVVGFVPRTTNAGEPCTLYGIGTRFYYGENLNPGDIFYVGETKGRLDGSATTGDTVGVAFAMNKTDIIIMRSSPAAAANSVADNAVGTGKIANEAVTEAKIEEDSLTGLVVKEIEDVVPAGTMPGIPLFLKVELAASGKGNTDVIIDSAFQIADVWCILTAAGETGGTLKLTNVEGSGDITEAMDTTGAAKTFVRPTTLDVSKAAFAEGETLRITTTATGSDQSACEVYILGFKPA